jgi:hypothetical protein
MQNKRVERSIADKTESAEISRVIPERTPLNQAAPLHGGTPLLIVASPVFFFSPSLYPFIGDVANSLPPLNR